MRTGVGAQLRKRTQPGEKRKLLDITLIEPARFWIGYVGEPFDLRGYVGELAVRRRSYFSLPIGTKSLTAQTRVTLNPKMYFIGFKIKADDLAYASPAFRGRTPVAAKPQIPPNAVAEGTMGHISNA